MMRRAIVLALLVALVFVAVALAQGGRQQKHGDGHDSQQKEKVKPVQGRVEGISGNNIDMYFEDWRAWVIVFQHGAAIDPEILALATDYLGLLRFGMVDVDGADFAFDKLSKRLAIPMPAQGESVVMFFPSAAVPVGDEQPPKVDLRPREVVESVEKAVDRAVKTAKNLLLELAEEQLNSYLVQCASETVAGLILYWGTRHPPASHSNEPPQWYNQAAHLFTDFFKFGIIYNPDLELLARGGVRLERLPSLHFMFTTDDVSTGQASFQAIQYPGELTLAAVFPFLNQMSSDLYKQGYFKKLQGRLDAKRFQSQQRQQDANLPPLRPLEQQTHENFEKNCNENTAGVCVIALLDAAPENIHLEQQLGTLRAVQELSEIRSRPAHFMWVDVACHSELCEELNIPVDTAPTVVVIRPRARTLARLTMAYEEDNIRQLVLGTLSGSVRSFPYSQISPLREKDCVAVHAEAAKFAQQQQEEEEDDINELLAEIIAKEKAREAEIEAELEREKEEARRREEEERRAKNAGDRKVTAKRTGKVVKGKKSSKKAKSDL